MKKLSCSNMLKLSKRLKLSVLNYQQINELAFSHFLNRLLQELP